MNVLELFCGVGGWSKPWHQDGHTCTGVDIDQQFAGVYPGVFIRTDCLKIKPETIQKHDVVFFSPPCEGFARAELPWLRGDHKPDPGHLELLRWSVAMAGTQPRRIVECSRFAARYVPGAVLIGSYAFWGDLPLLLPTITGKTKMSGLNPELRAEIPKQLSSWLYRVYSGKNFTEAEVAGLSSGSARW